MSNKKGFSFLNVEKVFSAESKKINKKVNLYSRGAICLLMINR